MRTVETNVDVVIKQETAAREDGDIAPKCTPPMNGKLNKLKAEPTPSFFPFLRLFSEPIVQVSY
jgi:hypothetical protein